MPAFFILPCQLFGLGIKRLARYAHAVGSQQIEVKGHDVFGRFQRLRVFSGIGGCTHAGTGGARIDAVNPDIAGVHQLVRQHL